MKLTKKTVGKLEYAFSIGSTITEACIYADIHRDTYYDWCNKDKSLSDTLERLRNEPILKARQAIFDDLDNPQTAKWYLERKRKDEFGLKLEQNNTLSVGSMTPVSIIELVSKGEKRTG